jgi:hypothetical protein
MYILKVHVRPELHAIPVPQEPPVAPGVVHAACQVA